MTEAVRTPEERFSGLPDFDFAPQYHEVEGLRLHYLDEGAGPPVVLFHGEPTWCFLYRKIIPRLVAAGYRAIAPDYAGFGRSDKPTDPSFYAYDRHVALIADVLGALDLEGAAVVVQDWGGPIGLRLAVEHQDWFSRLVVMNTGLFAGGPLSDGFMVWRSFVERTPDLPVGFVMSRSQVTPWADEVIAAYEAPFPDASYKTGAHQFPLIVPLNETDAGAAEMGVVKEALSHWSNPALVLFSTEDPVFSVAVGERFADRIPGAGPLELIEGAGHFLQEDQGEAVGDRIVAFLDRSR